MAEHKEATTSAAQWVTTKLSLKTLSGRLKHSPASTISTTTSNITHSTFFCDNMPAVLPYTSRRRRAVIPTAYHKLIDAHDQTLERLGLQTLSSSHSTALNSDLHTRDNGKKSMSTNTDTAATPQRKIELLDLPDEIQKQIFSFVSLATVKSWLMCWTCANVCCRPNMQISSPCRLSHNACEMWLLRFYIVPFT